MKYMRCCTIPIGFVLFAIVALTGCRHYPMPLDDPLVNVTALEPEVSQKTEPPSSPAVTVEIEEPTGLLTLRDALSLALLRNPELKVFSWDIRVSEAKQLQASLRPNPELGVEVEDVGGSGARSGFDGAETTIALSQVIEMGNKVEKRETLALLEKELAGWDYEAKRLDVFTQVTQAFIEVLAAQQRLRLSEELLHLSEELVNTVTKRVDAGKDSPLEKTKAEVGYSNVNIRYQQAVGNLEFARNQLASTWAGQPQFESVAGELDSLSPLPSIDQLINLISQNPDIARWDLEIDKGKASLELERAEAISDITLTGGMKRFSETDDNAIVFGISIPLPISDRNQGGKLEAVYRLARAREEQRAVHSKKQLELVRAYRSLYNAHTEATGLDKNILQGAESVFEASRKGYSEGKLDYLHVLDAQRTLFEVKAQYIDALVVFHTAKTDVERLVGCPIESLTDTLNIQSKEGNNHVKTQ